MKNSDTFKIPVEVVEQLSQRSDPKGLVQLLAHLGLLALLGSLLHNHLETIWFWPLTLVYGLLLTFLFAPLHETIHFTAFKTRWLNNLVAAVIGFFLFIPFRYFRAFHYGHHRHTQNPELDPELTGKKPMTRSSYWLHVSGLPIWSTNLSGIYQHATGVVTETYIESRKHAVIINEARFHLAGYAILILFSLLTDNLALWYFWILPSLLTQPFLRWFLLAEHTGCDLGDNMLENSRTTYTSPLINFLAWNMPYHAEHHYLASIPFHALPALHAWTGCLVKHSAGGYLQANQGIFHEMPD